jgi:hypothetical protein
MPSAAQIAAFLAERQSGSRHRSLLAEIAWRLDASDWRRLIEVGSNPLMSPQELAVLTSSYAGKQAAVIKRVSELERLSLIETPASADPRVTLEDRKVLTWRGIELLAECAGTTVETLRRRQPWPLRVDARKKGKTVYSLRWLRGQKEHHRLTRTFVLALLEGARRVSRPTGGVDLTVVTTIGGRLLYEDRGSIAGQPLRYVAPDAVCEVAFWRAAWLEGKVGPRRVLRWNTLLIEADRSTMASDRVRSRMDRYAEVFPAMAELRPALVWVVEGTPYREAQILEMLAERGLVGWTATLERLALPPDHPWWERHPLANLEAGGALSGLAPADLDGMCPWRSIWRAPGDIGQGPLLGLEPWRHSVIQRSPIGPRTWLPGRVGQDPPEKQERRAVELAHGLHVRTVRMRTGGPEVG